jgi:hypothetical protein
MRRMTKIACLGWGSLIWKPGALLIALPWNSDGPLVQVEFLRRSRGSRITLVLDESAAPVQSFWSAMKTTDLHEAVVSLRTREDIPAQFEKRNIGVWNKSEPAPPLISDLSEWAAQREFDAVIYTNLRRKFHEDGRTAAADEIVAHFRNLRGHERDDAEEYVRRSPPQIDTAYRRRIVAELGWTPRDA